MGKLSLFLAIVGSALSIVFDPLQHLGYLPDIRFLYMYFYIPACFFGTLLILKKRLYAKYRLLTFCILYACASLIWVDRSELNRGILVTAHLFLVFPVAALLAEYQFQFRALKIYLVTILLVLLLLMALSFNFGYSVSDLLAYSMNLVDPLSGETVTNRNALAFTFSLGVLFILVLQLSRSSGHEAFKPFFRGVFLFILLPILFASVIATGSRGASISLIASSLYLLFWSKTGQVLRIATVAIALSAMFMTIQTAKEARSTSVLTERFFDAGEVISLGDRVRIWRYGFDAFSENYDAIAIGFGSAGASKYLGEYADSDYFAVAMRKYSESDVPRLSAHNTFLDWLFCYGAIGAIFGGSLLISIFTRARALDKQTGLAWRNALFILAVLAGCTTVIYRSHIWVLLGSLVLSATIMDKSAQSSRIPAKH